MFRLLTIGADHNPEILLYENCLADFIAKYYYHKLNYEYVA
uniref:Uncharacterized protein n=1 Tax=Arundo donax TaxID=35708 RepID=A0A0A9H4W6_ARUDO